MAGRFRKLLAVVLSCALVMGCGAPATTQAGGSATQLSSQAVGTPWKDWFVLGVMTADDEVRLQDDYYDGVLRDWILEQNETGGEETSATLDRENQIRDQMASLIEDTGKTSTHNAHDLQNLRDLYGLYEDWDGRDADGLEPLMSLIKRLDAVSSLDDFTEWLKSDDMRLSYNWYMRDGATGVSLFGLSMYRQEDGVPLETDAPDASDAESWFVDVGTSQDSRKVDGYCVEVCPPSAELSTFMVDDEELSDEQMAEAYRAASCNVELAWWMLDMLGYSEDEANTVLTDAIALDSIINDAITESSEAYGEYTLAELDEKTKGGFPIADIIRAYGYDDVALVAVDDTAWLDSMNSFYKKDYLNMLKAYALVGLLIDSAPLLNTDAFDAYVYADGSTFMPEEYLEEEVDSTDGSYDADYEFTDEELAQYELEEKRLAMDALQDALPTSYAKLYVENYYDEQTTTDVSKMIKRIVDAYAEMLAEEDWLGDQTRRAAIEKLRSIRIQVGHPTVWANTSGVDVRSRAEGGTLLGEVRRLRGNELSQELYLLRHPEEGEYWNDCMDVNAYYSVGTNSITIGAGYLGGVYWPEGATYEQRLAGTGVTIGHELSHAFDSEGAYFDKNGNFSNWWTDDDLAAFEERVQKLVDYLSGIDPLGSGTYDGEYVCGEVMSDLGGMRAAMVLAAKDADFDYDAFFRAYAQSWRSVAAFETAQYAMDSDSHPLDRDRVNIPLRECEEFYRTYSVQETDTMWLDPADRVLVW